MSTRVRSWWLAAGFVVLAVPAAAQAADPAPPVPPRVEVGVGTGTLVYLPIDEGTSPLVLGTRVSVALSRRWAIEGVVDILDEGDDAQAFLYRAQARWRFHDRNGFSAFLTMGASGWVDRYTTPEYRWQDGTGPVHVQPSQTHVDASAPIYPSVGLGVQKTLGAFVALRAELTTVMAFGDDYAAFVFQPAVSLSIPIGRYPK